VSTRLDGNSAPRQDVGAIRSRRQTRTVGRFLLRGALWMPPAVLGAMLIAGPVSASNGVSGGVPAMRSSVLHGSTAVTAGATSGLSPCAVVLQPLPAAHTSGQQEVPDGPGSCLAPAKPSAPSDGTAVTESDNQSVVTQSIGVAVRAG
jgi:hypothetical protein